MDELCYPKLTLISNKITLLIILLAPVPSYRLKLESLYDQTILRNKRTEPIASTFLSLI